MSYEVICNRSSWEFKTLPYLYQSDVSGYFVFTMYFRDSSITEQHTL